MVHELEPIEHLPKGDAAELPLEVTENGSTKDITGFDVEYKLIRRGSVVADLDNNSDISATIDGGNGLVTVKFETGATSDFPDHVDEVIRLTDGDGDTVTFVGHIEFEHVGV